jgi:hypothetical protein
MDAGERFFTSMRKSIKGVFKTAFWRRFFYAYKTDSAYSGKTLNITALLSRLGMCRQESNACGCFCVPFDGY